MMPFEAFVILTLAMMGLVASWPKNKNEGR